MKMSMPLFCLLPLIAAFSLSGQQPKQFAPVRASTTLKKFNNKINIVGGTEITTAQRAIELVPGRVGVGNSSRLFMLQAPTR